MYILCSAESVFLKIEPDGVLGF